MKIAYVLATFPSITETFILREILALREKGHEVVIFALRRSSSEKIHAEAERLLEKVCYRSSLFSLKVVLAQFHFLFRVPGRYLRLLFSILSSGISCPVVLLKILRNFPVAVDFAREAEHMNVAHIHAHFAFVPADIAMIMAGLIGKKFSFSAHAWDIYAQKKRYLENKMNNAAFVVTCTDHGRDYLGGLFPQMPEDKIIMIRHGLFPEKFEPGASGGSIILAAGRLEEKKGFIYLLEACRLLKERDCQFECMIAGEGPLRDFLRGRISQYKLEGWVSLRGEYSDDELVELYKKASVFVLPSVITPEGDRDGLPNVILEAMAMKVPVISTDVSAAREAIENGINGFLVPSGNAEVLADKMEQLLKDNFLRERMGERGRAKISEDFDISRNIEKLIQLFTAKAGKLEAKE